MTTQSQPAFYAIIPATVRYCKALEMGARLLYGEITALCNEKGFCWATNKYFADLYQVTIRTINFWIKSLKDNAFIFIEIDQSKSGRKIFLKESLPMKEISGGEEENFMHNNTLNTRERDAEEKIAHKIEQHLDNPESALHDEITFDQVKRLAKKYTYQIVSKALKELSQSKAKGIKIPSPFGLLKTITKEIYHARD